MGINSTEVSYGFGQMGSIFNDSANPMFPPTGKVFVAITFLADTVFDASGGLVADTTSTASLGLEYAGTEAAAHNLTDGNETAISGSGGLQIDAGNTFPKGVTIYGRYTEIDLTSGMCIAYIGE